MPSLPLPPPRAPSHVLPLCCSAQMNSFSVKQLMAQLTAKFGVDVQPQRQFLKEIALSFAKAKQADASPAPAEAGAEAAADAAA